MSFAARKQTRQVMIRSDNDPVQVIHFVLDDLRPESGESD